MDCELVFNPKTWIWIQLWNDASQGGTLNLYVAYFSTATWCSSQSQIKTKQWITKQCKRNSRGYTNCDNCIVFVIKNQLHETWVGQWSWIPASLVGGLLLMIWCCMTLLKNFIFQSNQTSPTKFSKLASI